jgi:replication factor A1
MFSSTTGGTGVPPGVTIQTIDSINPFGGGKFWIKARVTDKGDIRKWNKPNSQGQLFSFTLVDESAAIRATVFQEAVDVLFPIVVNGGVYVFGGGSVKNANRKFSNVNNDYELTFDSSTQVIRQPESASIPTSRYNFVPISLLAQREPQSIVDVLAVVTEVSEVTTIVQKATGKELIKRNIKIVDMTAAVELTVWGDQAKAWAYPIGTVLAIRQAKIGSFDGVNLGTSFNTAFDISPAIPDVKKLHEWFIATGGTDVKSLSRTGAGQFENNENFHGRKFFDDIQAEGLGRGEKPDYIEVRCTPVYIKQDAQWYESCPTCQKKVVQAGADGTRWKCEKCDKVVTPKPRYLISIQASDGVSMMWLSLFNDAGVSFFGMQPEELKAQSEADPTALPRLIQKRLHRPMLLRLRVKEEQFRSSGDGGAQQGETVKCTVVRLQELFVDNEQSTDAERKAIQMAMSKECAAMIDSISLYV